MNLRLILMRHAKSDWHTPAVSDFDRPLNKRGRNAARAVGGWLNAQGYIPNLVLCSVAKRTRETWARVQVRLEEEPVVEYLKPLYLAPADLLLREIAKRQRAETILVLAHNPGIAVLAKALADRVPAHARFDDYPSAATTILEFETDDWQLIAPGTAQVVDFVVPRDILAGK